MPVGPDDPSLRARGARARLIPASDIESLVDRAPPRRSVGPFSVEVGVGLIESEEAEVARIKTVDPERARGVRRLALWLDKRSYGQALGITQIVLADLQLGMAVAWLYRHL